MRDALSRPAGPMEGGERDRKGGRGATTSPGRVPWSQARSSCRTAVQHVRATSFSSTPRPAGPDISRKDTASRPSVGPSCHQDRWRQDRVARTSVQRAPRMPLPPTSSQLFCRGGGRKEPKCLPTRSGARRRVERPS
ncbi:hypothetical protein NDU88_000136 [Pleurodeles waltl]|uniref:Uncharacterized protein n=1 Tax=Pleurodeles waltl TaxID=8319 RepID=A0AAV7WIR6_PLEWA|nr:hypothetical protein NDU88_000136 [Pleurodeles waltl]